MSKAVQLEIYTKTENKKQNIGIALMNAHEKGGEGYRIAGPKVLGTATLKTFQLNVREIDELISRLEHSKKFLTEE